MTNKIVSVANKIALEYIIHNAGIFFASHKQLLCEAFNMEPALSSPKSRASHWPVATSNSKSSFDPEARWTELLLVAQPLLLPPASTGQ